MSNNKTHVLITMIGGLTVNTTIGGTIKLLELDKLKYDKPLVIAKDEKGITIMVNLNHVLTIKYTTITGENNE